MATLQFTGIMPFSSYGDFARLPREIRDQIYEEYFSTDSPPSLERYLETNESEVVLFVNGPDHSILRVSRALYRESYPFWKRLRSSHRVIRMATGISAKQSPSRIMFLTLASKSLTISPPSTKTLRMAWLSCQWLHSPRLYKPDRYRRARLVFPSLKPFIKNENTSLDQSLDRFESILSKCSWRIPGRLNILIEDPTWPLLQPGEDVWYMRLHKGWTRRSLIKMRENHIETIMKLLRDLVYRFQKFFKTVTFSFGSVANGRHRRDGMTDARRIVAALRQQGLRPVIDFEYS